jgi:hypothetical protein
MKKKRQARSPAAESEDPGVARFTVHLFGHDLDRMRELRDYLRKLGVEEVNRSLLVKIALRGVEFGPELRKHLEAIQAEDGRRTRHQGNGRK